MCPSATLGVAPLGSLRLRSGSALGVAPFDCAQGGTLRLPFGSPSAPLGVTRSG